MMTPQEVQDKKFKQAMWGGYDMTAVDSFLEALTHDYNALFTENATLKKRLNSLTKKLEEYRKVDDDMRAALIEAQKVAHKRVSEANEAAQRIVTEAMTETQSSRERLATEIELEEKRLDAARRETINFVSNLRKLYTEQMEKLSFIPEATLPAHAVRKQEADKAALEIGRNLTEATRVVPPVSQSPLLTPPAPPPSPPSAPPEPTTPPEPAPIDGYRLELVDMDEFEREQDTEVPIRAQIDGKVFEQSFGHKRNVES